jgi:hypothetical protein
MTLLLIGIVCVLAARRALDPMRELNPGPWVAIVAGLVLFQLWTGSDAIARYRIALLGLRYAVTGEDGRPAEAGVRVSGDYDEADLYVPGAGAGDVALLRPEGDSALAAVVASTAEDAGALLAVEERTRFRGRRWRVLGASPVDTGDTITVRGGGRVYRLVVDDVADTLHLGPLAVPMPWARRHVLVDPENGARAVLPPLRGHPARRIRGAKPSVFARTYPLADIIDAIDTAAVALPALGSFLFYDDGRLTLADLDTEVERAGDAAAIPVWTPAEGGRRVLVGGLPLRDYPEPELTLPERYGIRALRTLRFDVRGRWLDVTFASPEVQAFDRTALETLRLPSDGEGDAVYRVRVSHAGNSMVREAIVFDAPPRSFAPVSQAVLGLPENPRGGAFDIVTPSGSVRWETGRPLPLGSADRALLVRVDGQSTSWGFWLVHAALFTLLGVMLRLTQVRGVGLALAMVALGLGAIRILLGAAALLEYPFVREGHQIGLWLLPVLPWVVVVAAAVGQGLSGHRSLAAWRIHAGYALAAVVLALVLFPDSIAKQAVLAAVPLAVLVAYIAAGTRWPGRAAERLKALLSRVPVRSGLALGAAFLGARILLDLLGWREGIQLGGTRIAVSVVYTPAAIVALAWLLYHLDAGVRDAAVSGEARRATRVVARALAEVAAFVVLAFVAAAAWISDFGIVLATLPGALVVIAVVAVRWTGSGIHGRAIGLAAALPLVLFVLVQASPGLLRSAWPDDVGRAEARLSEWNRNELLLLERGDPHSLRMIGQRRSEALAVMRETMRSYTRRNWFGRGFLESRVSNEIQDTATREHAVSALIAGQWGLAGTAGLVLLLLGVVRPLRQRWDRTADAGAGRRVFGDAAMLFGVLVLFAVVLPGPFDLALVVLASLSIAVLAMGPAFGLELLPAAAPEPQQQGLRPARLTATLALAIFACTGVYIVLANYGLVFFTGKNVYLLGLDSVSDALEALALLAIGAGGLAVAEPGRAQIVAARPPTTALPRRPQRALSAGSAAVTP